MRITLSDVSGIVACVTQKRFSRGASATVSRIFSDRAEMGVFHGLNRSVFIKYIDQGYIVYTGSGEYCSFGAIERGDGNRSGAVKSYFCMERAISFQGTWDGLCALRHTNHWMRVNYAGRRSKPDALRLFSNTTPIMPPWGGAEPRYW
jgi:LDH2 family malate/lactate/ureidoglycolate dehydrogenase